MNLNEFHIEEAPTDLDGARNVCITLDHVGGQQAQSCFGTLTPRYGVLNRFSASADVHATLMRNLVPTTRCLLNTCLSRVSPR